MAGPEPAIQGQKFIYRQVALDGRVKPAHGEFLFASPISQIEDHTRISLGGAVFQNEYSERLRQMFADQFEADGNGIFYRKYSKGAPIQVSAEERDGYVAQFNKFQKYRSWTITASLIILCAAAVFYIFEFDASPSALSTGLALSALLAVVMFLHFWAWNTPDRELRGRGTVGVARTRREMQIRFLEKTTYGQISAIAGAALAALLELNLNEDLLDGWNRLWLLSGVLAFLMAGFLAFRKWRFDRSKANQIGSAG